MIMAITSVDNLYDLEEDVNTDEQSFTMFEKAMINRQRMNYMFSNDYELGEIISGNIACYLHYGFARDKNGDINLECDGPFKLHNNCRQNDRLFLGAVLGRFIGKAIYIRLTPYTINYSHGIKRGFLFSVFTDIAKIKFTYDDYLDIDEEHTTKKTNFQMHFNKFCKTADNILSINKTYVNALSMTNRELNLDALMELIINARGMEFEFRDVLWHISLYGIPTRDDCNENTFASNEWGICCTSDDVKQHTMMTPININKRNCRCNMNDKFLLAKAFMTMVIEMMTKQFIKSDVSFWMDRLSELVVLAKLSKTPTKRDRELVSVI